MSQTITKNADTSKPTLFELSDKMPYCSRHSLYYLKDGECFYCMCEKAEEE